jgi:bifunctional DNase/RNase
MKTWPVVAALLLASLGQPPAAGTGAAAQKDPRDFVQVELSTVGVDPRLGTPIVLLRAPESGDVVPIWVGDAEARAIVLALRGVAVPRPMTHDLMASLLETLQATVEEVLVHDLRDSTYLGTVRLKLHGDATPRDVDSRPSDALALALRTGARILVARKILKNTPDFDFVAPEGPDQIVQLLGIAVVAPTPELRREHDLPNRPGVVVTSIAGRARDQGLRRGDLMVSVNGRPIREPMDFFTAVRAAPAGQEIRIIYFRDRTEQEIELPPDVPAPSPGSGGKLRVRHGPQTPSRTWTADAGRPAPATAGTPTRGRRIRNTAPPRGLFAAAIVPPCPRTISWAMASPRPRPPCARVADASA